MAEETGGQTPGRQSIIPINIEDEMRGAYIDYSMSVIISRALPDVRDGLKPVHRRVLYGMSELGVNYNKPYKKCARIVGDVLGKYHPHGDASVYRFQSIPYIGKCARNDYRHRIVDVRTTHFVFNIDRDYTLPLRGQTTSFFCHLKSFVFSLNKRFLKPRKIVKVTTLRLKKTG